LLRKNPQNYNVLAVKFDSGSEPAHIPIMVQHLPADRSDLVLLDYFTAQTEMAKRLAERDECLGDHADNLTMQMLSGHIGTQILAAADPTLWTLESKLPRPFAKTTMPLTLAGSHRPARDRRFDIQ
jgi:hypothetical protein